MKKLSKLLVLVLIATLISTQALATVTYTVGSMTGPFAVGGKSKIAMGVATLSGTYATNGFTVDPAKFGMNHLQSVIVDGGSGIVGEYVASTGKVKMMRSGAFAPTISSDSAGTPAGTVAAPTVTSDSAGTPAGTVAAPTITSDSAGTPAGTNAASSVSIAYTFAHAITNPTIALTHNADPVVNLSANPLFIIEGYAGGQMNPATLQSNCNATTDVSGATADGAIWGTASTPRFFVQHSAAPAGVQVYVNEAAADRLEFVSPTGADAIIVMPFESIANTPPGMAIGVRVHHSATAATGKALYFDDNGAADAQLVFVDAGAAGGTVPAGDVIALGPYVVSATAGRQGTAAGQTFTGSALGTHTHTAGAPAFTGSALGTHTHTAGAPAFTGSALGTHTHTPSSLSAAALAEVTAGVDLTGTKVNFTVIGW